MADSIQMLTPKEVAERLGVHQKTVHLWLRSGKLQGIKISYRAWRIPKESLDSFIETNSNRTGKPSANAPTSNNQVQKNIHQTILVQNNKDEIITSKSKMKHYIRDIMGEQSQDDK
jgi:excisionase family DNA binding protein